MVETATGPPRNIGGTSGLYLGEVPIATRSGVATPPDRLSGGALIDALQALGILSIDPRSALIREALERNTALAAGSPAVLQQALRPQLNALRQRLSSAFQAIDQRLGPSGAGQAERAKSATVAETAQGLQQLFAQAATTGYGGRLSQVSGVRPAVTANLPPVGTAGSSSGAFPAGLGDIAGSLYGLYNRLFVKPPLNPAAQSSLTTALQSIPALSNPTIQQPPATFSTPGVTYGGTTGSGVIYGSGGSIGNAGGTGGLDFG